VSPLLSLTVNSRVRVTRSTRSGGLSSAPIRGSDFIEAEGERQLRVSDGADGPGSVDFTGNVGKRIGSY